MSPVLDRESVMRSAPTTPDEALLGELRLSNVLMAEHRTLLVAILGELQSWRPSPAVDGPPVCPHPEGQQQDLSSMGHKWIRCRACGQDLVGKERP